MPRATTSITIGLAVVTTCAAIAGAATTPRANLGPTKAYLLQHTMLLQGFTRDFEKLGARYHALAQATNFDYARLWATRRGEVSSLLRKAKVAWIEGNPYYERAEGIVAGTPSLAVYDVILDAGASAKEDPAGAVPFDLKLSDGRVLTKPGNLFNLTEGMLWGTRPEFVAGGANVRADLDGDGRREFGEVLPDARVFKASADAFALYAGKLARAAKAWKPTASDAFTAVVIMVPTMNEYFGQWKVSRFVLGDKAKGESFNVVSRLSDIHDILTGLTVIYAGIKPAIARVDRTQAMQTQRQLAELRAFVADLRAKERAGGRFTPRQADVLGRAAQEQAVTVAGQVTQAAARLKVKIAQ
jgi:hypothetical protein